MPRYTKKKWSNKYVKNSHNCYSYMLNKVNKNYKNICKKSMKKGKKLCGFLKAQPGLYSGMYDVDKFSDYNCKMLNKRIFKDNKYIKLLKKNKKCPKKHYKGMLFIEPRRAYHFYRQDSNGKWSHKDGLNPITNRDARNKVIKNPLKSSRKYKPTQKEYGYYYSRHCGTYCIPESRKKKFFSAYRRTKKYVSKKNKKRKRKNTRKNKRKYKRKR